MTENDILPTHENAEDMAYRWVTKLYAGLGSAAAAISAGAIVLGGVE
ncbi:MAG: hypothetical protein HYS17_02010 [Micavibrio aeruginosavorus]|uniref:Uncharacterized protein n=1 Tax=Micavibrio aeruginosavorus TaxID=349221 RepID=A0A7T5UH45_9BACT|nr:MAG: hypothetical protein HYS17_02010 [Micavibrio aeruginosavorus]